MTNLKIFIWNFRFVASSLIQHMLASFYCQHKFCGSREDDEEDRNQFY